MRALVRQGLAEGAVGLSAGLTYAPGMYASDDELVALCRELTGPAPSTARTTATTASHALKGYADSIEIARRAGVPLHLAHAHLGFACNRGRAPELLALIDAARADGVDVTLDTYPYLAGATYLHALLPGWAHAGGARRRSIARLRDPDLRERLRLELEERGSDGFHDVPVEWDKLVLVDGESDRRLAEREGTRPIDVYCERCADSGLSACRASCTSATRRTCARPCSTRRTRPAATASSSATVRTRAAGARSRATWRSTCASSACLPLECAIRHMTSLPAQRLRLPDRGLVRPGMAADIVCLDPDVCATSRPTTSRAACRRASSTWP